MAPGIGSKVEINGKADMERVGLFSEVGYTTIGDRYPQRGSATGAATFNTSAGKGKQMMTTGSKSNSAHQAGYFEPTFKRIMEQEAYIDPVKAHRDERLKKQKKIRGRGTWFPSDGDKMPTGKGNHYGTLSGPIAHFSNVRRLKTPVTGNAPRNIATNPPKKGTGYGYNGLGLSNTIFAAHDNYELGRQVRVQNQKNHETRMRGKAFKLNNHPRPLFDTTVFKNPSVRPKTPEEKTGNKKIGPPFKLSSPGKHTGGCKAGCFDPYPSHSVDPYEPRRTKKKLVNSSGRLFRPQPGPKSGPTRSIMQQRVERMINKSNYKEARKILQPKA